MERERERKKEQLETEGGGGRGGGVGSAEKGVTQFYRISKGKESFFCPEFARVKRQTWKIESFFFFKYILNLLLFGFF